MHGFRRVAYILLLAGILVLIPAPSCVQVAVVPFPGGGAGEPGLDPDRADQVIEQVNAIRQDNGLGTLVKNDMLTQACEAYAARMAERGFFSHTDPDTGSLPWDRADEVGYEYLLIAENLAAGQASVGQIVNGWMNSPGHRLNILLPGISETGAAVYNGGPLGAYWVQMFAVPQP
jgi:uncharacterized protein YkwD